MPPGSRELERFTANSPDIHSSFTETWCVRKRQVIEELFAADVRMLSSRLDRLAALDRLGRDIPMRELVRGLKEITACLPDLSHLLSEFRAFRRATARISSGAIRILPVIERRSAAVSDPAIRFLRRSFSTRTVS